MIELALENAQTDDARYCLNAYYSELGRRFEEGFDPLAVQNFDPSEMMPPKGWFVVARSDGKAVGCGALKAIGAGVAEIKRVWTDDAMRGQGIAKAVMDRLEALAVENGLNTVRLDTNRALVEARAFYLKRGYHEIPAYNDNSYADHWFEKQF